MRALILAAGQGSRLRPYTDSSPKCLVKYQGRPILEHTLSALAKNRIETVGIVTGYCSEAINYPSLQKFYNPKFATTNMVESLFCAKSFLEEDTLIIYGDIVFKAEILGSLIESKADLPVVIDRKWRELWSQRMADPLADAETLKINSKGEIVELGKKPKSYEEIQGQYIGLFKLTKKILPSIFNFYQSLDRQAQYDGRSFEQMFMTSFLQLVIDRIMPLQAVFIDGGWIEIDTPADLNITLPDINS